jgi:predicted amidohydrolase YtcJ
MAATILLAGAPASASAPAPDAIFFNGKVVTVDPGFNIRQAFAVRGDRFVAVGSDARIRALAGKRTKSIDLHGATVVPGLTDAHDHLWNSAKFLHRGVDLLGVTTMDQMRDRLAAAVAVAKPGEVVFTTSGWSSGWMQGLNPTRALLDQISADVPIVVIRNRRGMAMMNSAALRKLGVTKDNPYFMGIKMPLDKQGEVVGAPPAYPASLLMVEALIPPMTPAQEDDAILQEMARRNALGITNVRDLTLWPQGVRALQHVRAENKMTVRIAMGLEWPDRDNTARHLAEMPPPDRRDPWLFLDSVGEEPFPPRIDTVAQFSDLLRTENQLGWRPSAHLGADPSRGLSDDDVLEAGLTAYEATDHDRPIKGKRWYVEHAPFATPTQIERMAKLGVVVSTQDAGYESAPDPLPEDRMAHENPIRSFMDHGLVVIGGSDTRGPDDADMTPNNPMTDFYFYVTRKSKDGRVRSPSEQIGRPQALRIFTSNAAYATFQDKINGSIEVGKLADFVVLNQDLLTVPDERILDTHPLATFVGAKLVYAAPGWRGQ